MKKVGFLTGRSEVFARRRRWNTSPAPKLDFEVCNLEVIYLRAVSPPMTPGSNRAGMQRTFVARLERGEIIFQKLKCKAQNFC